jgi:hypothetical protein
MPRSPLAAPLAGLATAFVALILWVSTIPWTRLDVAVLALFVLGAGLSIGSSVFGKAQTTRRVGVIALGVNAFGLLALACARC